MKRKEHINNTKHCPSCDAWQDIGAFHFSARTWDGLNGWCRQCVATSNRRRYDREKGRILTAASAWRKANPERRKAIALRAKFGLEIEDYRRIEAEQDGRCAICRRDTVLHVDHCHTTKRVRGLLCMPCNTAIGHLGDSPDRLRVAANYIEKAR